MMIMSVSGLSLAEYARIVGHYNSLKLGSRIDPRVRERGYTDKQLEILQEKMATQKIKEAISLNIKFTKPPEEFKYSQFGYVLTAYRAFKEQGVLLFPGSYSEQPAQIIEIFNTLESVELEFKEKELQDQERKRKRQPKRKQKNG